MKEQAIIWFQDSVKLRIPEKNWGKIDVLTERLIGLIGHPDFEHRIIKPEVCMQSLREKLLASSFNPSTVIDLGGLKHWTEKFLPNPKPVIGCFHLSRIRNVTSTRLDGCGHLLSMAPSEIQQLREQFDLTNPLIIDDVPHHKSRS